MSDSPLLRDIGLQDRAAEMVWNHIPGVATWRLTDSHGAKTFLKVVPLDWEPSLAAERDRLAWAADRLPVPRVIGHGIEKDQEWLLTEGLGGVDGTHPAMKADPAATVRLLGAGLRAFHGTPAGDCPFDFRLEAALDHVRRRVEAGQVHPERHFHDEFRDLTPLSALRELEANRPDAEDVVLCHGDYCAPNVLIDAGMVVGYVDLGELGIADRWWDIAVGSWSTTWNYGSEWEPLFLEAYGVDPDPERTRYYRLIYDMSS